jgi:hypothetical protein
MSNKGLAELGHLTTKCNMTLLKIMTISLYLFFFVEIWKLKD